MGSRRGHRPQELPHPALDEGSLGPFLPACRTRRASSSSSRATASAPVGRLLGSDLSRELFHATRIEVEPEADRAAVHRAFAEAVRDRKVLLWEREAEWREALEAVGLRAERRKVLVRRSLLDLLPPVGVHLRLASLAAVGEGPFRDRLFVASEGDPFEPRQGADRDLQAEWDDLVAHAGARFDPERWYLVDDDAGPVGVLLPQQVGDDVGTLAYVGVVPDRRGAGLGRALHAEGLRLLALRGLARYVGSTDARNAPMRRIFERNACPVADVQLFVAPPSP